MTRILGISGSLRDGSFNTALLRTARPLVGAGVEFEIATLHGIPLYDGDAEARDGLPPAVVALKEKLAAADGVLLATPEYNNGIPGVFKNAIDWLSRPANDIARVFGNRPFALIGASPEDSAPSSRRTPGCRCCTPSARVPGTAVASWFPAPTP
jgi:NAD(P)H-dependent FMN reductase